MHRNHPSLQENPIVIANHLQAETQLGRLIGPLRSSLVPYVHINPTGLIPKSHSDKWHLVVDLSLPRGRNVNDGLLSDLCSLHYVSIDNGVDIIMNVGWSTKLNKLDLSDAYHIIPVHPDDQPFFGIS